MDTGEQVPPDVTVEQASGQADPTNTLPVTFEVLFSEEVTGFDAGDVTMGGTATGTSFTVTGSGTTYTITVTSVTGDGTLEPTIAGGVCQDLVGNPNNASTSMDNSVTLDREPPETAAGPLPLFVATEVFNIPWTGTDNLSGVASVRLFYRRSAVGSFVQYGGDHTSSPIAFDSGATGGDGEYYFYTVGTDNATNQENPPLVPDAQTTVLTVPLTLTTAADPAWGGSVSPAGTTLRDAGVTVTVTAIPSGGWLFDHWSGDASGTVNPTGIFMDADKAMTAHFTQIPGPNLVGTLDDVLPHEILWGHDVSFAGLVFNVGNQATAESFWVELWAINRTTGWSGYLCDSFEVVGGLGAGVWVDLATVSPRVCYAGIPSGTYAVEMRVDTTNAVAESDESDNTVQWSNVIILPDLPDLRVHDFDFSPQDVSPAGGTTVTFSGTILNDGSQATTQSFWVEFRVSPTLPVRATDPYFCDSLRVTSLLAPGEGEDLSSVSRTTNPLAEGFYYVGIFLDPLNEIVEQREDNNVSWSRKRLRVGDATPARNWMLYK